MLEQALEQRAAESVALQLQLGAMKHGKPAAKTTKSAKPAGKAAAKPAAKPAAKKAQ